MLEKFQSLKESHMQLFSKHMDMELHAAEEPLSSKGTKKSVRNEKINDIMLSVHLHTFASSSFLLPLMKVTSYLLYVARSVQR